MSPQVDYLDWAASILTGPAGTRPITSPYLPGDLQTKAPPSPVEPEDVHTDLAVASRCAGDYFGQTLEILANSDITKLLGDHSILYLAERAGYGGMWDPHMELTTSGTTYVQGDFTIHAVDAHHVAFKHLPNGSYMTGGPLRYIIQVEDNPTCFFGGDASLVYDMKLWGELFRSDAASLGIDGVDLQGRSLDEMDPPTAAICAEMLGVKTVISTHYRTQEYPEQFQQYLAMCCSECHCLAMKVGESVTL